MKKKRKLKKFASNIAISFFFAAIFVLIFVIVLENKISPYISMINTAAVKGTDEEKMATYDLNTKKLINYPRYGSKYATLEIPSINLKLPVYYGDTKKILRLGVGHYYGSYFPGENGTIIYAGHNNPGYFQKLDQVKVGDKVTINASYGTFNYQITEFKVVKETDLAAFDVQHDKEVLIMYTCWPINRSVVGRKTQRFVVYAHEVGETHE